MSEESQQPEPEFSADPMVDERQDDENEVIDDESEGLGEEGSATEGLSDDEPEDVEFEGKNYKVPKALKEALLRNKDYTQKTQQVAEMRRALAAREEQAKEYEAFLSANSDHVAKIRNLADQVEAYRNVDWQALVAENPQEAQKHFMAYQSARDRLNASQHELQQMHGIYQKHASEALKASIEAGLAELKRDVPGFGDDLSKKLVDFGSKTFGFHPEELARITDPRAIKVLHKAYLYEQMRAKQEKPQRAPEPIKSVGSARPSASKDPQRMSDKEYAAWRRNRQAKRG